MITPNKGKPFKADKIVFKDNTIINKPLIAILDDFIAVFEPEGKKNILNLFNKDQVIRIEKVEKIEENQKRQTVQIVSPEQEAAWIQERFN